MGTRIGRYGKSLGLGLIYKLYNIKYDECYDKLVQSFCDAELKPEVEYHYNGEPYCIRFKHGDGDKSKIFSFNLTEPVLTCCIMYSVYCISNGKVIYNDEEHISGVHAKVSTVLHFLDIFESYISEEYSRRSLLNKMIEERNA